MNIPADDPLAAAVVSAIHSGDVDELRRLLDANPGLATARIVDARATGRTLLHIATDWPGHFPNAAGTIGALISAGAGVNAPVTHTMREPHAETPLHWAASSDDVAALDALLDGGANIEVPGAIFTGGSPMSDAVVFAQWNAARRLLERGAQTTIWQAASLGLLERVETYFASGPAPSQHEITGSFWGACRGGQLRTAEYLLARGADLNWVGYDGLTPLDAAHRSGSEEVIQWLKAQGAKSAEALK